MAAGWTGRRHDGLQTDDEPVAPDNPDGMTSPTRTTALPVAAASPTTSPPAQPGPLRLFVRRRPLLTFFTLSCMLSWWPAALYVIGVSTVPIAGFGPFMAALLVLGLTDGRAGIGSLLRSMLRWRVPKRSYVFAFGLPALASGAAVVATIATGGKPDAVALGLWSEIPVTLLLMILIPGLGGAWEEPGFRGYALPRLERRFGTFAGPLLLGAFWVAWHLPLFLAGQILLPDILVIMAASVVIAGLFRSARQSVLIAMVFHATNNAVGGGYASQLFHGADSFRLGIFTAGAWWILAVVVMALRRRADGVDSARLANM
ncbi:CPBP family intramembrane glutamic endopeptidase [Sphaerisporangium perillae]|uniref:CPBP family intramembrane glutamic endopeptidase n=1 Tax=Sphaerisporangium perillae TaxID=2935860 RepID=UPI00200DBBBD|nr:CPBP family intramembrane glutamic endopeptidase [Sphaerisporangium perillae]